MKFFYALLILNLLVVRNHTLFHENNEEGLPQCKWNPCLNGGLCTAHPDKYHCSCKPGWIGDNCEKRSNCFPNPCNHGACWPNVDGYTCTCKLGYKGAKCDMLDRCRPNPCKNNGACSETFEGVHCECAIGFKGTLCELESKCEPINPCMNGGVCHEHIDHYYCACSSSFQGQNCEAFIAPTKLPPTIPIKHEGPQAIPAPDNISTGDIHEIFTEKYTDSSGKIVTSSHEIYGPAYDGSSDPGASLVPHHPVPIKPPSFGSDNMLSETYHGVYSEPTKGRVGTPSVFDNDKFIIHSADEKETKAIGDDRRRKNASDITGHDDRYQTHLVLIGTDEHHTGVHVGNSIPETSEPINPVSNPHPPDAYGERAKQMNFNNKLLVKEAHEGQTRHISEQTVQEVYVNPLNDGPVQHLNDARGHKAVDSSDDTQTVIVSNAASTRSSLPKASTTDRSGSNITKQLKFTYKDTKQNSDINSSKPGTHTSSQKYSSKQNINKVQEQIANKAHKEIQLIHKNVDHEIERANKIIHQIATQGKLPNNNQLRPTFSKQKDAYSAWRRKALINFHKRNPNKPLPKNTLSLSTNSLCPKFCRLFCDPWCSKIGCCSITKDQQEMFQRIENENTKRIENKKSNFLIIEADVCDKCNENADCFNKKCQCKTGFHGDGVTCTIDNCLLCHLDAECAGEKCVCKEGFFGDGYECKNNVYQKALCSRCHKNADCIGGDCLCALGFFGNGTSCWPLPIPV